MMKKTWYPVLVVLLVVVVCLSGCQGFFPESSTIYEAQPTKIQYDISYGYQVNTSGAGRYDITYLCDIPEIITGSAPYSVLFHEDFQVTTLSNNTFVRWNISRDDEATFELGISAHVTTEGVLVTDLNGKEAAMLDQLPVLYPEIVRKYTHVQANETTAFINPDNAQISAIAHEVQSTEQTNNTFLLAKALFTWLKTNAQYKAHPGREGVQPAAATLQNKSGDCDDLSFLYISLCRSLGIPARFVRGYLLTPNQNGTADAVAHAWSEVFVGGSLGNHGWVPVECACCVNSVEIDIEQNFGVEDALHLRMYTDDGSNESLILSFSGITSVTHGISRHVQVSPFAEVRNLQVLLSQKLVVDSDHTRHYEKAG
jgi:transglutaminase-like putative cysteine protease